MIGKLSVGGFAPVIVLGALLACKKADPGEQGAPPTSETTATAPGVSFDRKPPQVGNKSTVDTSNDMLLDLEVKQAGRVVKRLAMKRVEREKKRTEVLTANDVAATRVRVTYLEKYEGEAQGSAEPDKKKSPIAGKTYLVQKVGDKVVVSAEGGGTVPKKELTLVEEDHKDLGQPEKLLGFLPQRPLQKGEQLPVTPEFVRSLFAKDEKDEMSVDQASFTFKGTSEEGTQRFGTFDIALKFTGTPSDGNMAMLMDLTGKLTVDTRTAWPISLALKGPLTIKAKSDSAGALVDGTGSLTFNIHATHE